MQFVYGKILFKYRKLLQKNQRNCKYFEENSWILGDGNVKRQSQGTTKITNEQKIS